MKNYKLSESFVLSNQQEHTLVINLDSDEDHIYRFSGICKEVLELVSNEEKTPAIIKKISTRDSHPPKEVEDFLSKFYSELEKMGIVVPQ